MLKIKIFICFVTLVSITAKSQKSVTDYVDLFICTAGDHGQLDPSATVPFGMIKLGPDTDPGNHSGYDFNSKKISGFSHNRISGTGCNGAGGNLRFYRLSEVFRKPVSLLIKIVRRPLPAITLYHS